MIQANIYQTDRDWLRMFSENLKEAMSNARFTQIKLSRETGIPQSSLSRYLQGTRIPSIEDVMSICETLNISVNDMINFDFYIL